MDLLVHDRGASDKEDTLMWQLARLCARIGAGAVPDTVYYMLVSGCLTALNKVSEEEQRHLLLTVGQKVFWDVPGYVCVFPLPPSFAKAKVSPSC